MPLIVARIARPPAYLLIVNGRYEKFTIEAGGKKARPFDPVPRSAHHRASPSIRDVGRQSLAAGLLVVGAGLSTLCWTAAVMMREAVPVLMLSSVRFFGPGARTRSAAICIWPLGK